MAAASTASQDPSPEEKDEARKERQLVRVLAPSVALTLTSGSMLFSARKAVALPLFEDAAELTMFMSRLASTGALLELVVSPVLGKLTDAYGRRCILPVANISVAAVRLLMFLRPRELYLVVLEQALTIPLVTSFFTTFRAAIGDHLRGAAFARANAAIGVGAGAAVVMGPLLAKAVMKRADPKYCYLLSVSLALSSLANLLLNFEESLPQEKRRPLVLGDMRPFGFLELMRSRVLSRLLLTIGMQTFTEGRNITDVLAIYQLNDLKWSWSQINDYVSATGVSLIVSGLTVKPLLEALGLIGFTTFSNLCNSMHLLCNAWVPPFSLLSAGGSMWLGVLFQAFGGRKRDVAEALIMKIGAEEGFGNGFLSGAMMNFRAIINAIGPLLFGGLYARGSQRGRPRFVFLAAVLAVLAAEASLRTLRPRELGLDERGKLPEDPGAAPSGGAAAAGGGEPRTSRD